MTPTGTCVVCGQPFSIEFEPFTFYTKPGVVDFYHKYTCDPHFVNGGGRTAVELAQFTRKALHRLRKLEAAIDQLRSVVASSALPDNVLGNGMDSDELVERFLAETL